MRLRPERRYSGNEMSGELLLPGAPRTANNHRLLSGESLCPYGRVVVRI